MRSFLINLKDRPERLEKALSVLNSNGISPEIYSATKPESPGSHGCVGQRGCYESHMNVLNMVAGLNVPEDEVFAVIEDDILLGRLWRENGSRAVDLFLSSGVDLLYLHCSVEDKTNSLYLIEAGDQVATHLYLVTKSSARKIGKYLTDNLFFGRPVDIQLSNPFISRMKTSFCIAFQDGRLLSDIANIPVEFRMQETGYPYLVYNEDLI